MYVISIQFRQIYTSSQSRFLHLHVARHTLVKLMNLIVNLFNLTTKDNNMYLVQLFYDAALQTFCKWPLKFEILGRFSALITHVYQWQLLAVKRLFPCSMSVPHNLSEIIISVHIPAFPRWHLRKKYAVANYWLRIYNPICIRMFLWPFGSTSRYMRQIYQRVLCISKKLNLT